MPTPTKSQLRKNFSTLRNSISAEHRSSESEAAYEHFLNYPAFEYATAIAGYYPMRREFNPLPLLQSLAKRGKTTGLPFITSKNAPLLFKAWSHGDTLVKCPLYPEILEPNTEQPDIAPTIILTPMLATDTHGNRLGYGGGFYDTTLKHLKQNHPNTVAVGLAFECQLSKTTLPKDEWDMPLDYLVTANGVMSF